jgi:hypothetical protein
MPFAPDNHDAHEYAERIRERQLIPTINPAFGKRSPCTGRKS